MKTKTKNSYIKMLQEGLIEFDKIEKYTGTVGDIVSYRKGKGDAGKLPIGKPQDNVVNILEREYVREEADDA